MATEEVGASVAFGDHVLRADESGSTTAGTGETMRHWTAILASQHSRTESAARQLRHLLLGLVEDRCRWGFEVDGKEHIAALADAHQDVLTQARGAQIIGLAQRADDARTHDGIGSKRHSLSHIVRGDGGATAITYGM